ncbi:MAG: hypothetical protein BWX86_01388 [Verrucomicrobia bacterium ADurb.Bin122]|nr:MAG: hypothetical protein BWX86_01388 [Verrucomicrobia bacterium ADurb.Bin122]
MDDTHLEGAGELGEEPVPEATPDFAAARHREALLAERGLGDVEQPLLHEVRDQSGVGAVVDHRRGPVGPPARQFEQPDVARIE